VSVPVEPSVSCQVSALTAAVVTGSAGTTWFFGRGDQMHDHANVAADDDSQDQEQTKDR